MTSTIPRHRRQNWWSQYCTELYDSMKEQQERRLEEWSLGYDSETRMFYESIEKRVLFKDVLLALRGRATHPFHK